MTKTIDSQILLLKVSFTCFIVFLLNTFCLAQNQADLEVKVQPSSENARGGETFSYTITINNLGSEKARDVIFIQSENGMTNFISYVPSKGNCGAYDNKAGGQRVLNCKLGDLEAGESILTLVEVKIRDFGNEYDSREKERLEQSVIESLRKVEGKNRADSKGYLIANISVSGEKPEENEENNHAQVYINLLPSKNLPPRVEINTPSNEAVITGNKISNGIQIKIKAFDPDGTIKKVDVSGYSVPIIGMISEDNQSKYIVWDRTYTVEELMAIESDIESHNKLIGQFYAEAENVGNGIYVYNLKNPKFGANKISVKATDDGGRITSKHIEFTVKGDATIDFVQPKSKQIFSPNSDFTFETISKLNGGQIKRIYFQKINGIIENDFINPTAELVSSEGSIFRHKYVWKNLPENDVYQTFQAVLIEESGAITKSEPISILIRNVPKIDITSLKNGQEFEGEKEIKILFEAKNSHSVDNFEIYIDGKHKGIISSGYIWINPEKGVHTIQIISKFDDIELSKSELLTIKVK